MNHFLKPSLFFLLVIITCSSFVASQPDWGFFGHRRINRMAVFTLPEAIFGFYKKHIEFVTEHAVDPDKRRYATKHEAVRHYIDIDHWGEYPFDHVPRDWTSALVKYTEVSMVNPKGDTIQLFGDKVVDLIDDEYIKVTRKSLLRKLKKESILIDQKNYITFFRTHIQPNYYEEDWLIDTEEFKKFYAAETGIDLKTKTIFAVDHFSKYGILPYNLISMQYRLTKAFEDRNIKKILSLSADFGHYIGDAHVPLHTTENYNGQLTDQVGIHAFWESRVPELFADKNYDFFVGKATYISDPQEFYWDIVLKSHSYLDSVLLVEKSLSQTIPEDKQFCFEERLGQTIFTQCEDYALAYSNRLDGMVEDRMRASVYALGCAWYTAWIDAGKPNLDGLDQFKPDEEFSKKLKEEEELFKKGEAKGRKHD